MKAKNPVIRNENLVSLSHEHHHGLVFCKKKKKVHQTDDDTIVRFVEDFWSHQLASHLLSEEDILLPYLWDTEMTTQFLTEHKQIRYLVKTLLEGNESIKENALKLSKLLHDHIRFEERRMFPWLENEALSTEELKAVGEKLEHTEISTHCFTPEFWKK